MDRAGKRLHLLGTGDVHPVGVGGSPQPSDGLSDGAQTRFVDVTDHQVGAAARKGEGAAGRADADAALDAAAELIEKCGIGALAPKLEAWRAEVAQMLDDRS